METHDGRRSSGSEQTLSIGIASSAAEQEECFRLRYRVYVDEMGKQPGVADHKRKLLTDGHDRNATILYVTDGNQIVGTMRMIFAADEIPEGYKSRYDLDTAFAGIPREQIVFTGYLIVALEWRQTRSLWYIFERAYRDARARGVWLDLIHCTPSLVALYETMGFRRFRQNFIDPDYGMRIPLALVADDMAHLGHIRSPLARLAEDFKNDPEHGRWFTETFSAYAQPSCARIMGTEDFLAYVAEHIYMDDHPLLRGLAKDEANRVVKSGTILRVRRGEVILRAGDAGSEMFMLLAGAAEVRGRAKGGGTVVLQTLGKGQIFGEMALLSRQPRTADVIAIDDVELLMLNRQYFEQLMGSMPAAAARVLWNLSIMLCERLNATTGSLLAAVGEPAAG
jgi:hypothetical protein